MQLRALMMCMLMVGFIAGCSTKVQSPANSVRAEQSLSPSTAIQDTPVAIPSIALPNTVPNPAVSPQQVARPTGDLSVVYAELLTNTIDIWTASVEDLPARHRLLALDRPNASGARMSLSHTGTKLAYTMRPANVSSNNPFVAELWLVDTQNPQPQKLAEQVDMGRYSNYPIWSPDDRWIVFYRQSSLEVPYEQSIVRVDTTNGQEQTLLQTTIHSLEEEVTLSIYPFDWSPNGRNLYYRQGYTGRVTLWRIDTSQDNQTSYVNTISEDARPACNSLSSDGAWLLCTLYFQAATQNAIALVATSNNEVHSLTTGISASMPLPIWHTQGKQVTLAALVRNAQGAGVQNVDIQTARTKRISLPGSSLVEPLSWSPDGQWLAVYTAPATRGNLTLVSQDGKTMQPISLMDGCEFIGWIR